MRCSLLIRFLNQPAGNCLPTRWSLFIWFPNLPTGDCRQGVKPALTCSEPTSRGLHAGSASSFTISKLFYATVCREEEGGSFRVFIRLRTHFRRSKSVVQYVNNFNLPAWNCLPGWSLCIRFPNLLPRDCQQGLQPDCNCSEPTSRGQAAGMYPVLQFPNLPSLDRRPGVIVKNLLPADNKSLVQFVYMVSEPTSRELSAWMEPFLYFWNLPPGDSLQGVKLALLVPNLNPGDCLLSGE